MSNIIRDGETITYDRDGNIVRRRIANHGERIKVSMTMLDHGKSAPATPTFDASKHMPHQLPRTSVDDARAVSARAVYVRRLSDSWRQGASQLTPYGMHGLEPAFEREGVAYEKSKARLSNKWQDRKPAPVSDGAYERYCTRLQDRWKS